MNLITVVQEYPDQQSCIDYLEHVRWGSLPFCPHCGSIDVARKKEKGRVGRWNCHDCWSSFNVLHGTVMQGTRIPLQKWFVGIALMIHAKKSISSCQLARHLEMDQKTCWYMQQRIRAGMESEEIELLQEIVEADESYLGGKPKPDPNNPPKRGRGTSKAAIVGAVQRGGNVIARMVPDVSGQTILDFFKTFVTFEGTVVYVDSYSGYNLIESQMDVTRIRHKLTFSWKGHHTNTIEGFWQLLKRALYGQHHHYSKTWMPLYVAEACWKYNNRYRDQEGIFKRFLRTLVAP